MAANLRDRAEWQFFAELPRADRSMAYGWWALVLLRGLAPALLAVTTGLLVGAVQDGRSLTGPLVAVGVVFVLTQVANPLHLAVGTSLGDRTAAHLYDELTDACVAPAGIGHLEDPELAGDLQVAREFDLGMTGPPLRVSMDFISSGLVEVVAGVASALLLFGFRWWAAPLLLVAWGSTHVLLRESGIWKDRNTDRVKAAQRDADYAYRMAVDPPAAKELRLFGLAGWTIDRFLDRRRQLHELQYEATRMRERSVLACLAVVGSAELLVFWALADAASDIGIGATAIYAQAAIGASLIAFGGLSWALDGAAAPVPAVRRFRERAAKIGALSLGAAPAAGMPADEIRFDGVGFSYPAAPEFEVLHDFDLTVRAGESLAIVGVNGAGKTTLAKLLCRLYDPTSGSIRIDGVDLRDIDLESWRNQVTAVFQDYVRFERTLRENVAPEGAPDHVILAALDDAGAGHLVDHLDGLDTPLSKAYTGGTDLSGGQWQRVALARTICAIRQGAKLVLLDEPTAQLDVRGEAAIFEQLLAATEDCTTILVSHRFSTVRLADRICVLEHGRVVELGTHDELMAARPDGTIGRYRTMYDLQAQRFAAGLAASEEDEEVTLDALS